VSNRNQCSKVRPKRPRPGCVSHRSSFRRHQGHQLINGRATLCEAVEFYLTHHLATEPITGFKKELVGCLQPAMPNGANGEVVPTADSCDNVTFQCVLATRTSAQFSALFLGMPVIEYIAKQLRAAGKAQFDEDGHPTKETEREMWILVRQALCNPALHAVFVTAIDREAITEAATHNWLEETY
jgi:hypothetical protein